ncbi:MAG TPA: TonB family protein [Candidatus Binatia bacterium]|nr:TonB family protein [Candidatus Binatia bacterium]
MPRETSNPTIILGERPVVAVGHGEKLSKWLLLSLFLHGTLIISFFIMPFIPARSAPSYPVYSVDLVGGEKIGGSNLGTELAPPPNQPPKKAEAETPAPSVKAKPETKKEKTEKPIDKPKVVEKTPPAQEKLALKEKPRKEAEKSEPRQESKTESGDDALERVRERLIQSAVERVKSRSETTASPSAKGEALRTGPGEGEGAAALGAGGRGGGVVKGIEFLIYQNKMFETIKANWAWVGQKSELKVVVRFGVRENGDIVGLKIVQASGDPSYDDSVLRALRKSSPLPAPPESYRKDFANVEITFRPKDLGA